MNSRKTILLVEDEAIIAIAQKMTLERYGYNVITVNSGERAYDIIKGNHDIDLILMDIDLGKGIDGPETAKIILTEREIPVVFLSSHTEPEVVEKTEKITSYGYVVKNSGITVLDASLKMAFKLFEANKRIVENEVMVRKKLDAILEPDEDISSLSLADIVDSDALKSLMEEFYKLTHIGIGILDIEGNVLVGFGWQDLCTQFHRKNPESLKNCIESDTILSKGVQAGMLKTYKCKNNLWEVMTPIEIGGKHLGNICLGQFFYEDEVPDYELFRNQARKFGFDETEYMAAVDRIHRWSRETVTDTMAFYTKLSALVSSLSYSKIKLSRALSQKDMAFHQLAESESRQNAMISNISDVVSIISVEGIMKYNSPNIKKWFGWLPEEIAGTDCWTKVHPDDLERIQKEFYTLLEKKSSAVKVECRYNCKDGSFKPVELTAANLTDDPYIKGVLLNFHDITDRREADRALLKSEERYIQSQKIGHVGNWEYDLQTSHFWGSDEAKRIYGFDPMKSDFSTDEVEKCIPERERVHQALIDLIQEGKEYNLEFEIHPRNSSDSRIIWSVAELVRNENGEPLIVTGVIQDITEQKQAEEALRKSQLLLKSSVESPKDMIILSIDNQYRYLYFNDYHRTVMAGSYGVDVEAGMNLLDCIINDEDRKKAEINYGRAQAGESHITIEEYGELNRQYYETRYNPIVNDKNEVIGATAFSVNVTERIRSEEKIRSLLHEKEMLLREVHHRIKNNMNTVYGLLMLQAESLKEHTVISALEDAASRVQTMMVLYDKLYQTENFKAISSKKYFPLLIDQIAANFPNRKLVKFVKNIEEFVLDSKYLQPLGIIINELLTNIMKYAFTGRSDGTVTVSTSLNGSRVYFEIQDNGNGLPESVNFKNSTGFGLQLVEILSEQIGGSIRIERGGGTKFILEFDV
jgi:PAS domain S-box-containing protein